MVLLSDLQVFLTLLYPIYHRILSYILSIAESPFHEAESPLGWSLAIAADHKGQQLE